MKKIDRNIIHKLNRPSMIAKNQINKVFIVVLVSLVVFQQMPMISDLYYSQIRVILYLLFGIFSFVSFLSIEKYLRHRIVLLLSMVLIYSFFLFLIILILGKTPNPFLELLIPFGILICSLNTKFSRYELSKLLLFYSLIVALMGVSSVFYYGNGFTIAQEYLVPSKNQIGPMLGISSILLFISIFDKEQYKLKHNYLIIRISLLILTLGALLAVRNRSGILGVIIITTIFLLKEFRPRLNVRNLLLFSFFSLLFLALYRYGTLNLFTSVVWNSLTLNYNITDYESLSAGRVEVYSSAVSFILQHLVIGEIGSNSSFAYTPHNYILNAWVKYGIVGSIPLVAYYLYLWLFAVRGCLLNRTKNRFSLPLWVLLFSLIVSIFEYTYPYGPGVTQLMLWFLIGQLLKRETLR